MRYHREKKNREEPKDASAEDKAINEPSVFKDIPKAETEEEIKEIPPAKKQKKVKKREKSKEEEIKLLKDKINEILKS